jgi:DNA-binding transcriptional ArsR family regulator
MTIPIHHPSTDDIDLATVLRALGDPARLTIVQLLIEQGEQNCASLQTQLGMPISTCSYHLRLLREAGVVRTRTSGTLRYMSVRRDDIEARFPGLLNALKLPREHQAAETDPASLAALAQPERLLLPR